MLAVPEQVCEAAEWQPGLFDRGALRMCAGPNDSDVGRR